MDNYNIDPVKAHIALTAGLFIIAVLIFALIVLCMVWAGEQDCHEQCFPFQGVHSSAAGECLCRKL